jgi:hypothetical protein
MADTKISALTSRTTLASTDEVPVVAGGANYRAALSALTAFLATATQAAGTLTASAAQTLTQTWNAGAVTFTALLVNVTDTASATASKLFDFQVGGVSKASLTKAGTMSISGNFTAAQIAPTGAGNWSAFGGYHWFYGPGMVLAGGFYVADSNNNQMDVPQFRQGAGILARRNGANAQVNQLYRTYTDASNYERMALQSGAGYFEIAAETAGTGTDDIDLRLTPAGTGTVRYGTHSAIAAETITGYITIKDAGGTLRKLAVVS